MSKTKFKFRDVSYGLQKLRDFLLGRKHTLHCRFPPLVSSRTLPPPEVPRGPETPYSNNYYVQRNAFNSVRSPIVAPIAEGPPLIKNRSKNEVRKAMAADSVCFNFAPKPGPAWWWDGHCYYEQTNSVAVPPKEEDPYCPSNATSK